jgi:hypothetical protein
MLETRQNAREWAAKWGFFNWQCCPRAIRGESKGESDGWEVVVTRTSVYCKSKAPK